LLFRHGELATSRPARRSSDAILVPQARTPRKGFA
jgi:hypothetical protein